MWIPQKLLGNEQCMLELYVCHQSLEVHLQLLAVSNLKALKVEIERVNKTSHINKDGTLFHCTNVYTKAWMVTHTPSIQKYLSKEWMYLDVF